MSDFGGGKIIDQLNVIGFFLEGGDPKILKLV